MPQKEKGLIPQTDEIPHKACLRVSWLSSIRKFPWLNWKGLPPGFLEAPKLAGPAGIALYVLGIPRWKEGPFWRGRSNPLTMAVAEGWQSITSPETRIRKMGISYPKVGLHHFQHFQGFLRESRV